MVSDKKQEAQAFKHHDKAGKVPVDTPLNDADPKDFDGLVLPGGVINPDALRLVPKPIEFVRHFVRPRRKSLLPRFAMVPGTLIDAGGVKGKEMTSWPSLKADLSAVSDAAAIAGRPRQAEQIEQCGSANFMHATIRLARRDQIFISGWVPAFGSLSSLDTGVRNFTAKCASRDPRRSPPIGR